MKLHNLCLTIAIIAAFLSCWFIYDDKAFYTTFITAVCFSVATAVLFYRGVKRGDV